MAPWDLTGLLSSPDRITRHLLAANQFVFDLQLLASHPGRLEALIDEVEKVVAGQHPRGEWLRDLTVYSGYHESLLEAARGASQGDFKVNERKLNDPGPDTDGPAPLVCPSADQPAPKPHGMATKRVSLGRGGGGVLSRLLPRELSAELNRGKPLAPDELAGHAYRGVSLGLPALADRLLWKTFAKGIRCRTRRRSAVSTCASIRVNPKRTVCAARRPRFGEFVTIADGDDVILDYGRANPRWNPLSAMRDRVVAIDAGTFLGRADIAVGRSRVKTRSFFTLERGPSLPEDVAFAKAPRSPFVSPR